MFIPVLSGLTRRQILADEEYQLSVIEMGFRKEQKIPKVESHVARNLYTLIRIVITLLECYYTTSALLHNTDELVVIRHPHLITIRMTYGYSY